jgi:hypothetical protein
LNYYNKALVLNAKNNLAQNQIFYSRWVLFTIVF